MLLDDDRNMKYQKAIEKSVAKLGNDSSCWTLEQDWSAFALLRAGAKCVVGCEANARRRVPAQGQAKWS